MPNREVAGEQVERDWWKLFVCPNCGGYGQNNLSIHLPRMNTDNDIGDCDPTKVEAITVRSPAAFERQREHSAVALEQAEQRVRELEGQLEKAALLTKGGRSYADVTRDHSKQVRRADLAESRLAEVEKALERLRSSSEQLLAAMRRYFHQQSLSQNILDAAYRTVEDALARLSTDKGDA